MRLLVRVGEERFGLPGEAVLEILDGAEPVRLPGAPPEVVGLINHRGSPATVVCFGFDPVPRRLVVLSWSGERIALAVDDVVGLVDELDGAPTGPVSDVAAFLEAIF